MFTFTSFVDALLKARGHRYIKRIPYMSRGKKRYRYIYKVTHTHRGKRAFDEAHLVQGTAFALHTEAGAEFHGHITAVKGDQITYRIDDGERRGESVTVSKSELLSQLNEVHDIAGKESAERKKLRSQIKIAKKKGSEKQVKRLEERLARLGGEQKRAEPEPESEEIRAVREQVRALRAKQSELYGDGFPPTLNDDGEKSDFVKVTEKLDQMRRKLLDLAPNSVAPYPRTADGGFDFKAFSDDQYFKLFTNQEIYEKHLLTSDPEYRALSLKLENLTDTRTNRRERDKIKREQEEIWNRVTGESLERLQGFAYQDLSTIFNQLGDDTSKHNEFTRIYDLTMKPLRNSEGGTKGELVRMRREAFERVEREEDQRVATQLSNASKGDTITRQGAEYKIHKIVDHSAREFNPYIEYQVKIIGTYVDDEPAVRRAPPARSFGVSLKTGEFQDLGHPSERSYKYYEGDFERDREPNEYGEILVDHEQGEINEWRGASRGAIVLSLVYPLPERLK